MKKLLFITLSVILCLSLFACGSDPQPKEPEGTGNILLDAEFKTAPVKNGAGNDIGTYGYIEISKDELKGIANDEFVAFTEQRVRDSGYNWVSIICDDETGICFTGSMVEIPTYGEIDNVGSVTKTIGNLVLKSDGTYEYKKAE